MAGAARLPAGREAVRDARLSGVHAAAELAAIVAGESRPAGKPGPTPLPDDHPPAGPASDAADLPAAVRGLYEPRPGFTNFHFNSVERDRVAKAIAATSASAATGPWELSGTLAGGGEFRIEIADGQATIDLPTGTSLLDATGELDDPSPPGSGGLLAALVLWRRLIHEGPAAIGSTIYWGVAPRNPATLGDPSATQFVDVLEAAVAGVVARFSVDAAGQVVGVELWPAPDAEACVVRFGKPRAGDPSGMPATMEVWRGDEAFGTFAFDPPAAGKAGTAAGEAAP